MLPSVGPQGRCQPGTGPGQGCTTPACSTTQAGPRRAGAGRSKGTLPLGLGRATSKEELPRGTSGLTSQPEPPTAPRPSLRLPTPGHNLAGPNRTPPSLSTWHQAGSSRGSRASHHTPCPQTPAGPPRQPVPRGHLSPALPAPVSPAHHCLQKLPEAPGQHERKGWPCPMSHRPRRPLQTFFLPWPGEPSGQTALRFWRCHAHSWTWVLHPGPPPSLCPPSLPPPAIFWLLGPCTVLPHLPSEPGPTPPAPRPSPHSCPGL